MTCKTCQHFTADTLSDVLGTCKKSTKVREWENTKLIEVAMTLPTFAGENVHVHQDFGCINFVGRENAVQVEANGFTDKHFNQ